MQKGKLTEWQDWLERGKNNFNQSVRNLPRQTSQGKSRQGKANLTMDGKKNQTTVALARKTETNVLIPRMQSLIIFLNPAKQYHTQGGQHSNPPVILMAGTTVRRNTHRGWQVR